MSSSAFTRSFAGADALYLAQRAGDYSFDENISGSDGSCSPSYLCEATPGQYSGPVGLGSLRGVPNLPAPTLATETPGSVTSDEATLEASVDPDYGELTGHGLLHKYKLSGVTEALALELLQQHVASALNVCQIGRAHV